jgi:carbon-monoxide dehydrogenase large subunit
MIKYVDVGGAFGTKSFLYPETYLTLYASIITKRPVKWVESRWEHLRATTHARDVKASISLAVRRDGRVVGLKGLVYADIGAYNISINANYAPFIAKQLTGPYDIPAADVRAVAVFTNKTPLGPYRGAGRPEAAFFYERMMDAVARELKIDPIEVRKNNLVGLEKMPYETPLGLKLDRLDYVGILKQGLEKFDYYGLKKYVEGARAGGRLVGLGRVWGKGLNSA